MVRGRDGLVILAAMLAAIALALVAKDVHVLDGVEDETVAMRFEARGTQPAERVAVVAIDDATFSDLEVQWPFKRSLHARAIDALRRAGAKQIVYDVQFTEPTTEREDLALFRAVRRAGDVVLATTETDGHGGTNVLGGEENLERAGAHAASANLETDRGGVIHRFPYATGGLRSVAVVTTGLVASEPAAEAFDGAGAWIDYAGPRGTVPTVSFSDLVSGRADPERFRGRVVVVGASAPTLQDVHSTPTADDRLMSGPEIQANAIATALRGLPLRDAPGWTGVLALLLLGAAPALAHMRAHRLRTAVLAPVAAVAFAAIAQVAFTHGWVVPVTYPLLALILEHGRHDERRLRDRAARARPRRRAQRRARAARARAHRGAARHPARRRAPPRPGRGVARRRHRRAHRAHQPPVPAARLAGSGCRRTRPS